MAERTLILEVAVPDFYTDDLTQEVADENFEGDFSEMLDASLRIANPEIGFDLETYGEKDGVTVNVQGRIVGAKIIEGADPGVR